MIENYNYSKWYINDGEEAKPHRKYKVSSFAPIKRKGIKGEKQITCPHCKTSMVTSGDSCLFCHIKLDNPTLAPHAKNENVQSGKEDL